jgi:formate dehydrogenase subunit beta
MNSYWKVCTHGDPIGTIQTIIQKVWEQQRLDGMLVFSNGMSAAHLIENNDELRDLNPFRPLMRENLAGRILPNLESHPDYHLGALLRPCEMRTYLEIASSTRIPKERLTTICVDCLGTFPEEEYQWRVSRKTSHDQLANEALQFARQEGILGYRYRAACQICTSPGAKSADVNIHVLGLPIRKYVLVKSTDNEADQQLNMDQITDGSAEDELIQQFEQMLAKQVDDHRQTTGRVIQALGDLLPRDLDAVVAELESCQNCQRCMEICPLCDRDFPYRDANGHYPTRSIHRWLVSCTGCGVCEQECKRNLPLSVIYRSIKEKLVTERDYPFGY